MRRSLGTAIVALLLVLLAGCTGGGAESGGGGSDSAGSAGEEGPVAVDPGAPGGAPAGPEDVDPDRQVVTTASASVAVEDPAEGARRVSELVESVGGRVEERTEQAASPEGQDAVADLVVRVPSDALTGVLADLEELGDVANVSVTRSDVTATAVDLDARISALQTSVARLQGLMDGAATTEALLAAEAALAERQEQLESLQSQRALLADQVALSTLHVHLEPFGVAPAGGPGGFLDGLGTGWRALVSGLGAALVVLGVVLPFLAAGALATAGALASVRLVRRRAAAPAGPPADQPPQPA